MVLDLTTARRSARAFVAGASAVVFLYAMVPGTTQLGLLTPTQPIPAAAAPNQGLGLGSPGDPLAGGRPALAALPPAGSPAPAPAAGPAAPSATATATAAPSAVASSSAASQPASVVDHPPAPLGIEAPSIAPLAKLPAPALAVSAQAAWLEVTLSTAAPTPGRPSPPGGDRPLISGQFSISLPSL